MGKRCRWCLASHLYILSIFFIYFLFYFHKQVGLAAASVGEAVQKVHSIAPIEQPAAQSGGMYLGHKAERGLIEVKDK